MEVVGKFKYLCRMLDTSENSWPAFYSNLAKARRFWGITGREVRDVRTSGLFCRTEVQDILFYGLETGVLTAPMLAALEGTHVGFARGMKIAP